jgi:hypothetical protein
MHRSLLISSASVALAAFLFTFEPALAQQSRPGARETQLQQQGAVRPVHNAGKLLRETALVKVHLAADSGRCAPTVADVALVFKVDDQYEISDQPSYWNVIDEVVTPAIAAECGGPRSIRIDNYVGDFRLAAVQGEAPRVFGRSQPFMTRREQRPDARTVAEGEAVELPLNRASLAIGTRGALARRFYASERDPTRADIFSIADARARFDRYTARESDRQRRAAATPPAASDPPAGTDVPPRSQPPERSPAPAARPAPVASGLTSELRNTIDPVLDTIRGWTPTRLRSDVSFLPYAYEDVLGDAFAGKFEPWLGRAPNWPDGLEDRAWGALLDVALLAYHTTFEQQCRSVPGKWIEWTRVFSLQQRNRLGPVGPDFGFTKTVVVREPFFPAFRVRAEQRRGGTLDLSTDKALRVLSSAVTSAARGKLPPPTGLPNRRWFEQDFKMLLEKLGCTSDATQQLEVNLHLVADGFPPLQELLKGTVK